MLLLMLVLLLFCYVSGRGEIKINIVGGKENNIGASWHLYITSLIPMLYATNLDIKLKLNFMQSNIPDSKENAHHQTCCSPLLPVSHFFTLNTQVRLPVG